MFAAPSGTAFDPAGAKAKLTDIDSMHRTRAGRCTFTSGLRRSGVRCIDPPAGPNPLRVRLASWHRRFEAAGISLLELHKSNRRYQARWVQKAYPASACFGFLFSSSFYMYQISCSHARRGQEVYPASESVCLFAFFFFSSSSAASRASAASSAASSASRS